MRSPATITPVFIDLFHAAPQHDLHTQLSRRPCAAGERSSEKDPRTRGARSTSTIRADAGSMRRNSDRSVLRTRMAIAPAISTPVGPAPTRTNVSRSRWRLGSSSASACSNAPRILFRIATASARFFNPGAYFSKFVMAEVAVGRACRQNQVIVMDRHVLAVRVADQNALLGRGSRR